jgi:hypothetical protein
MTRSHKIPKWLAGRFDFGLLVVFLLPIFVAIMLLQPGLPQTADGYVHLLRVVEIDQSWRDGVLYPRWAPDMAFGYGYPIFNFFAPFLYHLTAAIHLTGLGFESALKLVLVGCFLLGAWGTYALVRDIMGSEAGVLAAAAYVYAPFLLREVFLRGGYAQFLATCIMPAAFWSFYRLVTRDHPLYLLTSPLLCGAVIVSHNIGAILFLPFLAVFVFWTIFSTRRWGRLKWAVAALVLSLALVSFFLVPALVEKPLVKIDRVRQGDFDFGHHFLTLGEILSPTEVPDSSSLNPVWLWNLGTAQIVLGTLGLLGIVLGPLPRARKVQAAFFPLMLAGSVFMTLETSTPLWERVPLLALAMFPWRFLSITILAAAVLSGGAACLWAGVPRRRAAPALVALCLLVTMLAAFVHLHRHSPPSRHEELSAADVVVYEVRTGVVGTTSVSECMPIWVIEEPRDSPLVPLYLSDSPITKLDLGSLPDSASAELLEHTVVSDEYLVSSPSSVTLRFNTFYYPGWKAFVDSRPVPIQPSYPEGLITFPMPPGEHRVTVRFGDTPVRVAANVLSAATALALIGAPVTVGVRRRRSGLVAIEAPVKQKGLSAANAGILCGLLLALLVAKEGLIDPYTTWFRKASPPGEVLGVQHPAQVNLGDEVMFLGYDVSSEEVAAGGDVQVTLYWQAQRRLKQDYSAFLHLDDIRPNYVSWSLSEKLNPADLPTSGWAPGFYVSDRHRLSISPETPPGVYVLRAGLYVPDTAKRLPILDQEGKVVSENVELGRVLVRRAEPVDLSAAVAVGPFIFGQRIDLLGYRLEHDSVKPGNYFRLWLYWKAIAETPEDYIVFVHLLDADGETIAQGDGLPGSGLYPTWAWTPGEIVEDEHLIPLEAGASPGRYQLSVGLYELDSLSRLEARDQQGSALGDDVLLPAAPEVLAP